MLPAGWRLITCLGRRGFRETSTSFTIRRKRCIRAGSPTARPWKVMGVRFVRSGNLNISSKPRCRWTVGEWRFNGEPTAPTVSSRCKLIRLPDLRCIRWTWRPTSYLRWSDEPSRATGSMSLLQPRNFSRFPICFLLPAERIRVFRRHPCLNMSPVGVTINLKSTRRSLPLACTMLLTCVVIGAKK